MFTKLQEMAQLNEAANLKNTLILATFGDSSLTSAAGTADVMIPFLVEYVRRGDEYRIEDGEEEQQAEVDAWAKALEAGDFKKAEKLFKGWEFSMWLTIGPISKVLSVDN